MPEHVYVLRDKAEGGAAKIGFSVEPPTRLKNIKSMGFLDLSLEWHSKPVENGRRVEQIAHAILSDRQCFAYPVCPTEWFNATADEARKAILSAIRLHKVHGKRALDVAMGRVVPRRGWVYDEVIGAK